jgi:hypothetical protein
MNEIGLTGVAHLPLVFEGGKYVCPAQELQIGFRAVASYLLEDRLETNHGGRCLIIRRFIFMIGMIGVGPRGVKATAGCS